MSEDVKPRQFWINKYENDKEVCGVVHKDYIKALSERTTKEKPINVIELEPTLQLMEEMGNKLSEVENYLHFRTDDLCGDDIKGDKKHTERFHQLTKSISYSLEKYRKFKEGLK